MTSPVEHEAIDLLHILYRAMSKLGDLHPRAALPGIAAVRRLLCDEVGWERQRELVGEWNAAMRQEDAAQPNIDRAMTALALDGIAFAFVREGMPMEWAIRHQHLFHYMLPGREDRSIEAIEARRIRKVQEGDHAEARISGNARIAVAVLEGDSRTIRRICGENLDILARWLDEDPDMGFEHEFEEHRWLMVHAVEMAEWGRKVASRLEQARS